MISGCNSLSLPLYEGVDWNHSMSWSLLVQPSLPLYEGVDWNRNRSGNIIGCSGSPSLRGSGLKCCSLKLAAVGVQSLPLYEGVDWNEHRFFAWRKILMSPSLRGSGLKLDNRSFCDQLLCLPLYEGVDWNPTNVFLDRTGCAVSLFTREWIEIETSLINLANCRESPSLRGSGLKSFQPCYHQQSHCVSLFTREWIEMHRFVRIAVQIDVSLFTREWIEIIAVVICGRDCTSLPLYEGVDWNTLSAGTDRSVLQSPSLRGSGLKLLAHPASDCDAASLPLYEGVDWNTIPRAKICACFYVSLFTREWIEIHSLLY